MKDNLAYKYEIPEELIDGKPVAMSPRPVLNHTRISGSLFNIFFNHLKGKDCEVFSDGVDLFLSETDRFIPDMMVVCDKDKIKTDGIYGAPSLVVEVLSPGTAKRDRGYKKEAYEKAGVKEYWIVNPIDRSIEVFLLEDGRYHSDGFYALYPESALIKMTEEEKAALPTCFPCRILKELEVSLEEVFWYSL